MMMMLVAPSWITRSSRVTTIKEDPVLVAYVYILASRKNGTLYVGVTSDLLRRIHEHKLAVIDGFTKRYGIKRLVWFEVHESIEAAIRREKRLKKWPRLWKTHLIEKANPAWRDLFDQIA